MRPSLLRTGFTCLILALLMCQAAAAQTGDSGQPSNQQSPPKSGEGQTTAGAGSSGQAANQPEPYKKDEFPRWLQDLWRAEVVFVGSLPFTFFFSLEGYDLYIFAKNGFKSEFAPWPFRSSGVYTYDADAQLGIIISTLTVSLLVAGVDFIINRLLNSVQNPDEKI